MQVTETLSQGLKREFKVVVPAAELDAKVNERLNDIKGRVQIAGFRPGKVPVSHLKRVYGRATMAEVIEATVRDANNQIVNERGFKLAADPKVTLPSEQADVEKLIGGQSDLDYTVAIEILPPIELADFKTFKLTRLAAEVSDTEVEDALKKLAEQNRPFKERAAGEKAAQGDRVTIDFTGSIEGKPFEGGTGGDVTVAIGSNTFIPGFEEQLVGVAAGDKRTVNANFPPNYMSAVLAGKAASFAVTVKKLETPSDVAIDDDFAKSLGLDSLAKLRELIKERLERDHNAVSRQKLKRGLLDQLDAAHKFDPPPTLVSDEFDRIWKEVTSGLESEKKTFADENTTEEKARAEYQRISERRVRLGLVLAEIGEKNKIQVSDEEVSRAVVEQARQFPGQEQRVWEYYKKNPQALASVRAPIYEEKVVDFLLELAKVDEQKVSREELFKEDEPVAG